MAEALGEALLEIGTDDRRLKRGLSAAEKRTRVAAANIGKIFAGLVTIAAVRGLVRSFDRVITKLDAIAKQADKLGLTTEALQEMRFAAERSGVAVQTFDMAFQRFTRRAGEAAKGTGEAKDALKELGFTLDDLRDKSPEELFEQAAAALADTEDAAERLRLAFKLFDSEGVAIVNMVANLADLRQEARDLGIVLEDDVVRAAVEMRDEITNIVAQLDTIFARLVLNFLRNLDDIFRFTRRAREEADVLRQLDLAGEIAEMRAELGALSESAKKLGFGVKLQADLKAANEEMARLVALEALRSKQRGGPSIELGGGGGADTSAADAAADRARTITAVTEAIENQILAIGEQAVAFELSGGALAENIALNRAFNDLRREGIELTTEESDALRLFAADLREQADGLIKVAEAHRSAAEAARDHDRRIESLGDSFADAIVNIRDMESALASFQNIMMRFLSQMASSGLSGLFTQLAGSIVGAFSGGGNLAAANAGGPSGIGLSTPGFAHGGSFTVGGRGGVDRNLVQFKASRGERVTVDKAGAGSGVEVNVFAPPGSTVDEERNQSGDMEQINIVIDKATARNMRPGTQTARAMRSVYGQRQTLIAR